MPSNHCEICLQVVPTLIKLKSHYLAAHSKLHIINALMKMRDKHEQKRAPKTTNTSNEETETLFLDDDLHITYGNKEIIIERASQDAVEISLENVNLNNNENGYKSLQECENLQIRSPLRPVIHENDVEASETGSKRKRSRRSKVGGRENKRYKRFRLDFRRASVGDATERSLSDKNGEFYSCNCSNDVEIKLPRPSTPKSTDQDNDCDIINITSDTESSSDTGKQQFYPIIDKNIYCNSCGSGYKSKLKLLEHMQTHVTFCKICHINFQNEYLFKIHLKTHFIPLFVCHICQIEYTNKRSLVEHLDRHLEQDIIKNVIDLEQHYKHYLVNFDYSGYKNKINGIVSYLQQNNYDYVNNALHLPKISCELCYQDVYQYDYENHLKFVHFPY